MKRRRIANIARVHGEWGEDIAAEFLRRAGYEILERNSRPVRKDRRLDIDIVAYDKRSDAVVFVEVKQRKTSDDAAYSIDGFVKKRRIAGARYFLMLHGEYETFEMRFDAVLFGNGKLPQHIKNAWECD